ncbi:helix-turn-helix transcriptional regulator [Paraburkholderia tropica]|uniref:AraC-type DNA-binding protein n=1 Tax=Paraburkholderia tropica TaxID=92647 RepID=A0A1A5XBU7_9BURK|nr:helix-turn-helix transcriptional regulator [Paraburkholderia tropica]MBB2980359.1 AraC-like DNA-binding protein [Paraburkholderia tropica]MBB3000385.1 AraC-like DNA-binding protein [Paraburkholderia tropica]MBB6320014.1 AraC-like DNA-binding protein [Paraburkholderia tropica]OBR50660.1 AraC family transcriptional regulator [Paraburkholderia tropica]RQN39821.1 AraC family transcriptional regulator [Paraburkholderia tropica]
MFSMLYFPLVSSLATPEPVVSGNQAERFGFALREGKLLAASHLTSRWIDETNAAGMGEQALHGLQLHADLQLLLGVEVEAEEAYRRSLKLIRSSKRDIRASSCRNAAWQALFRHRIGTALSCFARVVDEPGIEPARAAEARFGIVCALHELGRTGEALQALDEFVHRLDEDIDDPHGHWHDLATTVRFDLEVQTALRCASELSDHVYWQSGAAGVTARTQEDVLRAVRVPLLRARIEYLRHLQLAALADRNAIGGLQHHLNWAREQGVGDYQRTLRLEIALAALAGAQPHYAHAMLEPLHPLVRAGAIGHRHIEYLYCAAKTRQAQGRAQESLTLYSRYALVAMQCLREDASLQMPLASRMSKPGPQLDDVGARLPARYRRAYSYVLDNLDRPDLSVREIAAEIGVTERALQSAFKNFLGLSPSELIRRQRMERIRAELTERAYAADRGVLVAANKWGVQNRSTLVNGYRKQFHEAPSETLER